MAQITREQALCRKETPILSLLIKYGLDNLNTVFKDYDFYTDGRTLEIYHKNN